MDRDGVVNRKMPEGDYVKTWEEFEILPDVPEAIRRLNENGFMIFVVSNQRGVARGIIRESVLIEIHRRASASLRSRGARVDGFYYCPHDIGDDCACRKPKPGLLLQASTEHAVDLAQSWMIGDRDSDIEAGRRAGCRTVRIGEIDSESGGGRAKEDLRAESLLVAVGKVLAGGTVLPPLQQGQDAEELESP